MEWIVLAELIPAPVEWNLGLAVVGLGIVTSFIPAVVALQRIVVNQLAAARIESGEVACAPIAGRAV